MAAAALALAGCPKRGSSGPDAQMQQTSQALTAGTVSLDGEVAEVRWSDGDTFRVVGGAHKGTKARLAGFNTLEDYGPVHRWGEWTPQELWELARAPEKVLSDRGWTCTSSGDKDKYDRLLVECPEVARTLVGDGLAMVFAIDQPPDESLLAIQQAAIAERKGMWRKGVPAVVVTSVHSVDEGRGYNRVVDPRTGMSKVRSHEERYETCQEVCEGPEGQQSCMTYVPYERRYKNKPECLP